MTLSVDLGEEMNENKAYLPNGTLTCNLLYVQWGESLLRYRLNNGQFIKKNTYLSAQLFVWHCLVFCCHIIALVSRYKYNIMWLVFVKYYPAWIMSQQHIQLRARGRWMGQTNNLNVGPGGIGSLRSMHTIMKTSVQNTSSQTQETHTFLFLY